MRRVSETELTRVLLFAAASLGGEEFCHMPRASCFPNAAGSCQLAADAPHE